MTISIYNHLSHMDFATINVSNNLPFLPPV